MGWWSSDTAELSFDDCEVPVENLLGAENKGFAGIMVNFQKERLYLSVEAHAVAEMALEESIKYAKERIAFGKPLTGFQVTRHKLAEMATQVEVAKQMSYSVAARLDTGRCLPGSVHGEEFRHEGLRPGGLRCRPDPRRLRILPGIPRGAALPRLADFLIGGGT